MAFYTLALLNVKSIRARCTGIWRKRVSFGYWMSTLSIDTNCDVSEVEVGAEMWALNSLACTETGLSSNHEAEGWPGLTALSSSSESLNAPGGFFTLPLSYARAHRQHKRTRWPISRSLCARVRNAVFIIWSSSCPIVDFVSRQRTAACLYTNQKAGHSLQLISTLSSISVLSGVLVI